MIATNWYFVTFLAIARKVTKYVIVEFCERRKTLLDDLKRHLGINPETNEKLFPPLAIADPLRDEDDFFDPTEGCCIDCGVELCTCGNCHTPACENEDDCNC